jgi:hypothetical protein
VTCGLGDAVIPPSGASLPDRPQHELYSAGFESVLYRSDDGLTPSPQTAQLEFTDTAAFYFARLPIALASSLEARALP